VAISDVTRESVFAAIREYDELGQDEFLARHRFGRTRKYVLVLDGKAYDSKAIFGVAHRYETGKALPASAFSGGVRHAVAWLKELGFEIHNATAAPGS
jgi:5-methylcytosine-specific restriction protein A